MDISGSLKAGVIAPLHSWDVLSIHLNQLAREGKRKVELQMLERFRRRYHWEINLEKTLSTSYEALVLTDSQIAIQWVSDGFTNMTGYPKNEVLGKNPSLLHGANTTRSSRNRVREQLYDQGSFTEDIANYRKTGEEYVCRVHIHPIFNVTNNLCHYLALEHEVR